MFIAVSLSNKTIVFYKTKQVLISGLVRNERTHATCVF